MRKNLYDNLRKRVNLRKAWSGIRKNGLSSGNIRTQKAIRQFDNELETKLDNIYRHLLHKCYKFEPVTGVPIVRSGKEARPIVVATIRDRLVQRALLRIVVSQPGVKKVLNSPYSFGVSADRSVPDAIGAVLSALRDGGAFYIRSDIEHFFRKIPRKDALIRLGHCLSDSSLEGILDESTTVELDNISSLSPQNAKLYPTEDEGVGQGFSLSPLLGNLVLEDFDSAINVGSTLGLRYVDDFIIIGPDQPSVWDAFRRGNKVLRSLGMSSYSPTSRDKKAAQGSTGKKFDFLGCTIAPRLVIPNKESRRRLLNKIDAMVSRGKSRFEMGGNSDNRDSLITVLSQAHLAIRSWGNHYSFCNGSQVLKDLDARINDKLATYLQRYKKVTAKCDRNEWRRLLGVHLLIDSKSKPII